MDYDDEEEEEKVDIEEQDMEEESPPQPTEELKQKEKALPDLRNTITQSLSMVTNQIFAEAEPTLYRYSNILFYYYSIKVS